MHDIDKVIRELPASPEMKNFTRGLVSSYNKRPSPALAGRIEAITGISADYTAADEGEEPLKVINEN